MYFKGEYRFTKSQVSDFYAIDNSTIDRYLSGNEEELKHNGYENLKGKSLKDFKDEFGWMLQEGSKAPQLGVFNFRAFLNLAMLLTESEKAKAIRTGPETPCKNFGQTFAMESASTAESSSSPALPE